jgi:hypothetical protein
MWRIVVEEEAAGRATGSMTSYDNVFLKLSVLAGGVLKMAV